MSDVTRELSQQEIKLIPIHGVCYPCYCETKTNQQQFTMVYQTSIAQFSMLKFSKLINLSTTPLSCGLWFHLSFEHFYDIILGCIET